MCNLKMFPTHCIMNQSNKSKILKLLLFLSEGIGFGLINLPCIMPVLMYFDKKRAFAVGTALCGAGINDFLIISTSLRGVKLYLIQMIEFHFILVMIISKLQASEHSY